MNKAMTVITLIFLLILITSNLVFGKNGQSDQLITSKNENLCKINLTKINQTIENLSKKRDYYKNLSEHYKELYENKNANVTNKELILINNYLTTINQNITKLSQKIEKNLTLFSIKVGIGIGVSVVILEILIHFKQILAFIRRKYRHDEK